MPRLTATRAAIVRLMSRYIDGLLDPFVSLIEIHKLMYFLQEAGEPLRLNYKQSRHGLYAENLRHALSEIEGYIIYGYLDGGDSPIKKIELVPGAEEEAKRFIEGEKETSARFEKVSRLLKGFESPFGLELLSSIHWVVQKKGVCNISVLINELHTWNKRKKLKFSPRQIEIGTDALFKQGWISKLC